MLKEMQDPEGTRRQVLEAALATLKEVGFAGATSRAIAERGNFNSALVFYYFGSMDALLLAALDWTSEHRLTAYREVLAGATTIDDVLAQATRLYREDIASGHVAVVSQMIAGGVARPELAGEIVARLRPWVELCEEVVERTMGGSALSDLAPPRELASALVTFYLGANLLTHLDPSAHPAETLLDRLETIKPLLGA
jgi:AcrR family transcriptional regulator